MAVEEKNVDSFGRIVLPKRWRGRKVWVLDTGDELKVLPRDLHRLTEFFDEAVLDVESLTDYHLFRNEMNRRGQEVEK